MRLEDIRQVVNPDIGEALDALRSGYVDAGGDPDDLDGFVGWLRETDKIDDDAFRAIHAGGTLVLNDISEARPIERRHSTLDTFFPDDEGADAPPTPPAEPPPPDTSPVSVPDPSVSPGTETVQRALLEPKGSLGGDDASEEPDDLSESSEDTGEHAAVTADTTSFAIRARRSRKRAKDQRLDYLGKLAQGAMGEIHIARDLDLQRKIAVKRMTAKVKKNPTLSARFFTEAQITAQLDHPNIVPVYSLEPDPNGGLAYTMKLIRGKTFAQIVDEVRAIYERGRRPPTDSDLNTRLEQFIKVCDAIHYAHSRGVVHRDLKPENIMVGAFGEVFVMDWGIARLLHGPVEKHDDPLDSGTEDLHVARTRVGTVIGTPAYMSPEQAEGNNELVDARSDQFSLGLILYELVCLRQAMAGKDPMSVLLKVQRAQLEPFRYHPPREDTPRELQAIIRKATQKDPRRRYPSVRELADDVRRYLRGEPTFAMPDSLFRKFRRWVSRHSELMLGSILFLVLVIGVVAVFALGLQIYALNVAEDREARLTDLLGSVSTQAHVIDTRLLGYQALLKMLASNATEALSRPPDSVPEDAIFADEQFDPPDLVRSNRYVVPVSFGWPVSRAAQWAEPDAVDAAYRQLTLLRRPMRRMLLASISDEAVNLPEVEALSTLRDGDVPVAWMVIALENGVFVKYPGHALAPRTEAGKLGWYKLGRDAAVPRWGLPHTDKAVNPILFPCAVRLEDKEGNPIGVAGIELSFDSLRRVLAVPQLADKTEAFLVEPEGRILIKSSEARAGSASHLGTLGMRLQNFPDDTVRNTIRWTLGAPPPAPTDRDHADWTREDVQRIVRAGSGTMVLEGKDGTRQLFALYRMSTIPWVYVVSGRERDLLSRRLLDLPR